MSFCCGASMIGIRGTRKYMRTLIHNVPLLFCPVCHQVEVHYMIADEYDILAEFAHGDGAFDVNFEDYVEHKECDLFENCVNHKNESPWDVIRNQIDIALDLLNIAKVLQDEEWEGQLKHRLIILSKQRDRMKKKAIRS